VVQQSSAVFFPWRLALLLRVLPLGIWGADLYPDGQCDGRIRPSSTDLFPFLDFNSMAASGARIIKIKAYDLMQISPDLPNDE
jgi:hypothetical protein